jgi:hypothetical protein
MKEEFISNNESNEIEITKYGKKKNHSYKDKLNSKKIIIYSSLLLSTLLFLTITLFELYSSQNNKTFSKELNENDDCSKLDKDKLNEIALRKKLRPYPIIQYFLKRTKYAFLNIFKFSKIKREDIDIDKLKYALNKTIYNHPSLLSRFYKDDKGDIYMEYRPDLPPKIEMINIKDEDIKNIGNNLLTVFEPFNSSLVNFTIFISETSIYFFYDIFHSNFDGNSLVIFENNLELAYMDKPLPKDYFYLNLYQYNLDINSQKYNDTVKFFQDNFDLNREYCPKFDKDIPDEILNNKTLQLIYREYSSEELRKQLTKHFGEKPRYYNIFMSMNILLTNYIYSNYEDDCPTAKIGFNGRNWEKDKNSVGCLIMNFPVIYHFEDKKVNMKKFYTEIKKLLEMKPKLMKFPFEHTEKHTSMMAIIQTKDFYKKTMFGKPSELLYGYNNYINMRSEYVMSPIMQELFIDDNIAKYSYFFDGKFYKESSADRFMDILAKTSKFIMDYFGNDSNISLENTFKIFNKNDTF